MKQLLIIVTLIGFFGCKKTTTPSNENEHEAITKVSLLFFENGIATDTFSINDPDGDGGNLPLTIDTIYILKNKSYTCITKLYNSTQIPAKDVTQNIINQANAHELFYLHNTLVNITRTDKDNDGFTLGLNTIWQIPDTLQSGIVRIKLMHKPFIKGNNDSHTLGHSDVDVNFPLTIK